MKTKSISPTLLAVPLLVLLNTVAIGGQAFWFAEHVTRGNLLFAVAIAVVVELVGVFLASMAHAAVMANQSAGSARPGSYAVGILAGWLNFAHWGGAAGVTFGLLSVISPYLWSVWSRYRHRQLLAELGQVDKRGLRLSMARKIMHPVKSFRLFRFAAWEGLTDIDEARMRLELSGLPIPTSPAPFPTDRKALLTASTGEFPTVSASADLAERVRIEQVVAEAMRIKHTTGKPWEQVASDLGISGRTLQNYRRKLESVDVG